MRNDRLLDNAWLDLSSRVHVPEGGYDPRDFEDFVLSPNYAEDQTLYVSYTPAENDRILRVSRITVPSGEEEILLDINFADGPGEYPYLGGDLALDPEGLLYICVSRGYSSESQLTKFPPAQDLAQWDGKILRIDVSGASGNQPYTIPSTNPFVDTEGVRPEIWAYGLATPRIAIDEQGHMFVVDSLPFRNSVGRVEINVTHVASGGGSNFGWPFFSGVRESDPFKPAGLFETPEDVTLPLYDGRENAPLPDFAASMGFASEGGVLHCVSCGIP